MYVQDIARIGAELLGHRARPVTELPASRARSVFVAAFDAERLIGQLAPSLPEAARVFSLDAMRLPAERLTNRRVYLDPLNFATNFAFFRDTGDIAHAPRHRELLGRLRRGRGELLADAVRRCGKNHRRMVRGLRRGRRPRSRSTAARCARRFATGDFAGQLFLHVVGAAGHDVVKYALDVFGDTGSEPDGALSCTHDANAWPADRYAGLPAPAPGERVILWVQNSHPTPIPAGAIGLNPMGEERVVALRRAARAVRQPRGRCRRAAAGSSPGRGRSNCAPASMSSGRATRSSPASAAASRMSMSSAPICGPIPELPELAALLGKGYLLPAPILPASRVGERAAADADGAVADRAAAGRAGLRPRRAARWRGMRLGLLPRDHATALRFERSPASSAAITAMSSWSTISPASGGSGDGWLHALFRYRHRASGHAAETSFGAHVFNTLLVYRGEPQSYAGPPPGLSTRLFLRLGDGDYDTLCHLIYPASRPWRPVSATEIILHDRARPRDRARRSGDSRAPDRACSAITSCSTPERAPAPATAPMRSSATRPAVCSGITACWAATARSASTTCSAFDREFRRGPASAPGRRGREKCYIVMSN